MLPRQEKLPCNHIFWPISRAEACGLCHREEEDLFIFNDTVEGRRAPAVQPRHKSFTL
jgi:hypothetical protein